MDIDLSDPHHLAFFQTEDDRDGSFLIVGIDAGNHFGKGISLAAVEIRQSCDLIPNFGSLKDFSIFDLQPLTKLRVLEHRIPSKPDFTDGKRLSFGDGVADDEPFFVFGQFNRRLTDSRIEISFIEQHLPDPLHIVVHLLPLQQTGIGEKGGKFQFRKKAVPGNPLSSRHHIEQFCLAGPSKPIKYHRFDTCFLSFCHVKDQAHPIVINRLNHRGDLRTEISVLLIGKTQPLGTLFHLLLVEKRLALDGRFLFQLLVAQMLVSVKDDLTDEGFFPHNKRHRHTGLNRLSFHLHILEKSGVVQNPNLATHMFGCIRVIRLEGETTNNRRYLNPLGPPDVDRGHFRLDPLPITIEPTPQDGSR